MNSAAASIATPYPLTERRAINPWIIAVAVTLATFMELLDTALSTIDAKPGDRFLQADFPLQIRPNFP